MKITTLRIFVFIACIAVALNVNHLYAQGTWSTVSTPPHANGGGMLLLTDGTVLVKTFSGGADGYGNTYDRLTPNASGSYANGTWTSIAPMANTRLYYSSQVLKDGRVYVAGGEYGTGGSLGEVYNPLTNTWTAAPAPGSVLSDANSEILEDGRVLQALVAGSLTGTKIYNPATNTYSNGPTALGIHNESAWIKLQDNSILYVNRLSTSSERYIPATNTWIADATVPVQLYDAFGDETGGALLLPDGRAFFLGSAGHNAIYTPSGTTAPGTWAAAADFPNAQGTPDAPAAMMVNGKILCNASPVPTSANHFPSPTTFYEYDYTTNTFTAITAPGGGATLPVSCYVTNMLDLPDGTVLYSRQNSSQYYIYTPSGSPLASGKPIINNFTQTGVNTYSITGSLFNGISQGATYGDDWQMASNYPLVRLTSGTNVYYCRTSNWNSTGVRRFGLSDTVTFTLPAGLPNVTYSLVVVANGIASTSVPFSLTPTAFVTIAVTSGANPSCVGAPVNFTATPVNGGTTPTYQWLVNGANAGTNSPTFTTSTLTTGQTVSCIMTSNLAGVLGNPATSNTITMTVNNPVAPAVSIAASATTICAGSSVTFTATPVNGGLTPSYQWQVAGVNAGTNSATFNTSALTNGQVVTCIMTSNSNCVTTTTATSNAITMNVTTSGTTLSISSNANPSCAGSAVTFTATAANVGLYPVYQWKVNGVNAGTNSTTFTTSALTNGQTVSCTLTSNSTCVAMATLGTGVNLNTTTSDLGAAYPTYYGNGRQQYLIKASELTALGLSAGNITSVAFNIAATVGDPATLFGYTIKMASTTASVLTSSFQTGTFTTVYGPVNYSPVISSVNTHNFTTPFAWDGLSNVLVDICFSNQVVGTISYQSYQSQSAFVSTAYYQADGAAGAGACGITTASGTGSVRPNMIFTDAIVTTANSNVITMTVNPLPVVTAANVTGCPGSAIQLSGTPAGGTWSVANPYTGPSTTYTHSFTDGNGCTNTSAPASITILPLVAAAGNISTASTSICANVPITFTTGAIANATSYNWTVTNGAIISSGQGTQQVVIIFPGAISNSTVSVNGYNVNCSGVASSLSITVLSTPSAPLANDAVGCQGSPITLSGIPAGGTYSVANPYTGGSTTFVYTITNLNGCSASSLPGVITVNPLPVVTAANVGGCAGSPIALAGTPTGGTWSVANPYTGPSTTYTHSYTDANGCSNTSAVANINVVNSLSPLINGNTTFCTGSTTLLDAGAGYTSYLWSTSETTQTISVSTAATFTVTVTNANGCTGSAQVATTVNLLPVVTAANVSGCAGSAIALSGLPVGGTWSVANPYTGPSTTYTHSYTDANGCSNTSATANITVSNSVNASISGSTVFCVGNATALNAGAGYTSYLWSTSATTQTISVSTAGTFTVTVTNANGCTGAAQVTTTINPLPVVSFTGLATSYLVSAAAATLTGSPVGGVFSGAGISGNTFNPSVAGVGGPYTITYTYTNGNGCSNSTSQQTTVTNCTGAPAKPSIITGQNFGVCNSSGLTYAVINVTGVTYNWSFNVTTATIATGQGSSSITANYLSTFATGTLRVTASNACGTSAQQTLAIKAIPATPISITGPSTACANQIGVPYSTAPIASAVNYTWVGPSGSKISDGVVTSTSATLITTATAVTVNFKTTAGTVKVRANNACGSGAYFSQSVTFNCRDINGMSNDIDLSIVPNPNNGNFTINFDSGIEQKSKLQLLNTLGQTFYSEDWLMVEGVNSKAVDITNQLAPGIYYVVINTENGIVRQKFVKE